MRSDADHILAVKGKPTFWDDYFPENEFVSQSIWLCRCFVSWEQALAPIVPQGHAPERDTGEDSLAVGCATGAAWLPWDGWDCLKACAVTNTFCEAWELLVPEFVGFDSLFCNTTHVEFS